MAIDIIARGMAGQAGEQVSELNEIVSNQRLWITRLMKMDMNSRCQTGRR